SICPVTRPSAPATRCSAPASATTSPGCSRWDWMWLAMAMMKPAPRWHSAGPSTAATEASAASREPAQARAFADTERGTARLRTMPPFRLTRTSPMPATGFATRLSLACLLLLTALPAAARWTGKGEAGLAFARGNSDSRTANARVHATHKDDGVEWSFGLGGLYVRNDGNTTARRWERSTQARFDFLGTNFWYGGARYEEDPFSGFHHQGLVTTGAGRRSV